MPLVADVLDIRLAWLRVKNDHPDRVFVSLPCDIEMVHVDAEGWLAGIERKLNDGSYNPSPMRVCAVPKPGETIRPGACLTLEDQVVYAALIGACLPAIHSRVAAHQGVIEFSYPLNPKLNAVQWLKNPYRSWTAFRTESLARLAAGATHMVTADISSFYDNIDLVTLASDLRAAGCPPEAIELLSKCLNKWVMASHRGIPQGYSASDILQKLYLHSVDATLRTRGYSHVRYSDDARVFCHTRADAKRAIMEIAALLRHRGLQLQSAKTEVRTADEARNEVEGISPLIAIIQRRFLASARAALALGGSYLSVGEADRLLNASPDDPPLETITETYRAYFIDKTETRLNSTLFHFLLNRLGKQSNAYAVDHALSLLPNHPYETDAILNYAGAVEAFAKADAALVSLIGSPDMVYNYQTFQALRWIAAIGHQPSTDLLKLIRERAMSPGVEWYVAATARHLLGRWGETADLEALQELYAHVPDSVESAHILCALKRMELGRRNAFLARSEVDGDWQRRGARVARG